MSFFSSKDVILTKFPISHISDKGREGDLRQQWSQYTLLSGDKNLKYRNLSNNTFRRNYFNKLIIVINMNFIYSRRFTRNVNTIIQECILDRFII